MARSPLMMPEQLRPWAEFGFEYLLLDEQAMQASRSEAAAVQKAKAVTSSVPSMRPRPEQDRKIVPPASSPVQDSGQQSRIVPDLATWPEEWRTAWSKVPQQASVVITYAALGDDLCGNPSTHRRGFFAQLLGTLSWPKGCVAFWPFVISCVRDTEPSTYFIGGLESIAPQAIFFFGRSFQLESGFTVEVTGSRATFRGIPIYKLPELSSQNLDHPGLLDHVSTRMTALFSPYS